MNFVEEIRDCNLMCLLIRLLRTIHSFSIHSNPVQNVEQPTWLAWLNPTVKQTNLNNYRKYEIWTLLKKFRPTIVPIDKFNQSRSSSSFTRLKIQPFRSGDGDSPIRTEPKPRQFETANPDRGQWKSRYNSKNSPISENFEKWTLLKKLRTCDTALKKRRPDDLKRNLLRLNGYCSGT